MRATKANLLIGWSLVLAYFVVAPFLSYKLALALGPACAMIVGLFIGPTQGRPLGELVEENPRLWAGVAIYYLAMMILAFYCALFQKDIITFILESSVAVPALLAVIFGPFAPSIYRYERERYRNAPDW